MIRSCRDSVFCSHPRWRDGDLRQGRGRSRNVNGENNSRFRAGIQIGSKMYWVLSLSGAALCHTPKLNENHVSSVFSVILQTNGTKRTEKTITSLAEVIKAFTTSVKLKLLNKFKICFTYYLWKETSLLGFTVFSCRLKK